MQVNMLIAIGLAALIASPAAATPREAHCAAEWIRLSKSGSKETLADFARDCKGTAAAKKAAARLVPPRKEAARPARSDAPSAQRKSVVERDAAELDFANLSALFSAREYSEAQATAQAFVARYPVSHARWSHAQDLLGRAYFADAKFALATSAFYENYRKAPNGGRAAASLVGLGESLTRLGKLPDACKAYDEVVDAFRGRIAPDLRTRIVKGRVESRCANVYGSGQVW